MFGHKRRRDYAPASSVRTEPLIGLEKIGDEVRAFWIDPTETFPLDGRQDPDDH